MPKAVRSIRTSDERWQTYQEEAALEGMTVNGWVTRALDDAVALARMIRHQAHLESLPPKNVN